MPTARLYVGADNATGEIDLARVAKIAGKRHDGLSETPCVGYWLGQSEPCAQLVISDDRDSILATVEDLKSELHQDAIGIQWASDLTFI